MIYSLQEAYLSIYSRKDNLVLNYLLNEGYANDLNSARIILENMSDTWLYSLLNEKEDDKEESLSDMFKRESDYFMAKDNKHTEDAFRRIANMKKILASADVPEDKPKRKTKSKPKRDGRSAAQIASDMLAKIDAAQEVMRRQDRENN